VAALGIWFYSQSLLGARPSPTAGVGDGLHRLTAPLNSYFGAHANAANVLLIVSSGLIDCSRYFCCYVGCSARVCVRFWDFFC